MKRKMVNFLLVDDADLECEKDESQVTLDDINVSKVGFLPKDLEPYDVIVYKGRRGTKVLKLKGIG